MALQKCVQAFKTTLKSVKNQSDAHRFLDYRVHHEFNPQGQIGQGTLVGRSEQFERHVLLKENKQIFYHDNMPSHFSINLTNSRKSRGQI